jgi:hypothetical protein
MIPAEFYHHALYADAVDWPPYGSLIAAGPLPEGGNWCVLVFDRKPPDANAVRLPPFSDALLRMLKLQPHAAHWEGKNIAVAATGQTEGVWRGPYVNLPYGKYKVAFKIEAVQELPANQGPAGMSVENHGDASIPLFELTVSDGFGNRKYASKAYRLSDLEPHDGGAWASLDFAVPESSPTRTMEFDITTFGNASFTVSAVDLHRQP